jgi:hypothetical protein
MAAAAYGPACNLHFSSDGVMERYASQSSGIALKAWRKRGLWHKLKDATHFICVNKRCDLPGDRCPEKQEQLQSGHVDWRRMSWLLCAAL